MKEKKVPLHRRIRREKHREIAKLQDMVVETLYRVFPKSVLHGGTAIWRCYSGNRFSEDVDVYMKKDVKALDRLFEELKRAGFEVAKKRVTKNSLYSVLSFGETEIRLEALFQAVKGVVREYETYEGVLFNVFTLLPEEMIAEKIAAYLKRRKIRDLYDIFFLLRHVMSAEKVKPDLVKLLEEYEEPVDERELRTLVIFGAVPTSRDIIEYIRRWAK
ncbi:MAG: nucleotidyl transferase AbiEii/AbiGii toxin family protein [Candidatus Hadarchaeales archaeon]